MKKGLKRAAIIVAVLLFVGFIAFLYFIPPFTLASPDTFSGPELAAPPALDGIKDPATRLLAERGRYLVTSIGCTGCHTPGGDSGPNWDKYLAGGVKLYKRGRGTFLSRNLTPDSATGLARFPDREIMRILRSGLFHDGSLIPGQIMPWPAASNWSAEDLRAVVVYLRHLHPVHQAIPEKVADPVGEDAEAAIAVYPGDYGIGGAKK
jgi:mono/diheme cytochrome c family protein